MFKAGVSIYIGLDYSLEENIQYLKEIKKQGIKYCFTSMHLPEAKNYDDLNLILKEIKELDLKLIVDISKPMVDKIDLPKNIYALRLDWGFSDAEIVQMSQTMPFKIELNASTLTEKKLNSLISLGLDLNNIRVSHNFYPKRHTGLSLESIISKNEIYHQYGLIVMAYLPSKVGKRAPLFEGLPTIERHRDLSFKVALTELVLAGCDEVFIGDAFASSEELKCLASYDLKVVEIPIELNQGITIAEKTLLESIHRSRLDEGEILIRSSLTRGEQIVKRINQMQPAVFDIIIDNELYSRYQGEISIVKKPIPNDERFNIVGKVVDEGKMIVKLLKPGSYFKFIIQGGTK